MKSSFNKFLTPQFAEKLRERFGAKPGDILFFVADKDAVAFQSLGALRIEIARRRGLIPEGVYDLFWVTEFPLFEYSEEEGRYVAMHHPFTSWMPEDEAYLENEKDRVRARAYDLVMNGIEMGSGSIRIHRSDMQAKMFKMIGLSDEEAQHRFGFLTDAFKYGTPPHGGFAFGLDRLSMILTGSDSLRDVVAFPKAQGRELPDDGNARGRQPRPARGVEDQSGLGRIAKTTARGVVPRAILEGWYGDAPRGCGGKGRRAQAQVLRARRSGRVLHAVFLFEDVRWRARQRRGGAGECPAQRGRRGGSVLAGRRARAGRSAGVFAGERRF